MTWTRLLCPMLSALLPDRSSGCMADFWSPLALDAAMHIEQPSSSRMKQLRHFWWPHVSTIIRFVAVDSLQMEHFNWALHILSVLRSSQTNEFRRNTFSLFERSTWVRVYLLLYVCTDTIRRTMRSCLGLTRSPIVCVCAIWRLYNVWHFELKSDTHSQSTCSKASNVTFTLPWKTEAKKILMPYIQTACCCLWRWFVFVNRNSTWNYFFCTNRSNNVVGWTIGLG